MGDRGYDDIDDDDAPGDCGNISDAAVLMLLPSTPPTSDEHDENGNDDADDDEMNDGGISDMRESNRSLSHRPTSLLLSIIGAVLIIPIAATSIVPLMSHASLLPLLPRVAEVCGIGRDSGGGK